MVVSKTEQQELWLLKEEMEFPLLLEVAEEVLEEMDKMLQEVSQVVMEE